ncbi:IclR family transcriptional regulator [Microtetraspora malaysiensis]|uniref:IclR family transcriptional regulator n=1 Tax=Microtetraspora malaysiensis TaxID=161358 RepID=UPI003D8BD83F
MKGLRRATEVLRLLAERPMRPADLAREMGVAWATVYRTVSQLCADGHIVRDPGSGEYLIGPMTWMLATAYIRDHPVLRVALPHLESAVTSVNGMLKLCERIDGSAVTLFAQHNTGAPMIRRYRDQYRVPLHVTAYGYVLLASQPEHFVDAYLADPLPAFTPNTVTDPDAVRAHLAEIREQGYAIVHDDLQVGIGSIAYPVLDRDGSVRAAVGCTLLSDSLNSPQQREEHEVLVANLAATIANSLGWNPLNMGITAN